MKILILFTGGTIGSAVEPAGAGATISLAKDGKYKLLAAYRAQTHDDAEFDTAEPMRILSEQMTLANEAALIAAVKDALPRYDGIVVTHGTDTLAYTAAALSYACGLCKTPVVLVSSGYVIGDPRANGVDNLAAALALIRSGRGRGVYVSYRNTGAPCTLYRASRLLMHQAFSDTVFPLGGAPFLFAADEIVPVPGYTEQPDGRAALCAPRLAEMQGRVLQIFPTPALVYPDVPKEVGAILHHTYHSGTLRTDAAFAAFNADMRARGIPVFVSGFPDGVPYESTTAYTDAGVRLLPHLSPLAAFVKLTMLLASDAPLSDVAIPLGGDL